MQWLFLLIFSFSTQAAWQTKPKQSQMLDLNPIKFDNKARCALESRKPTQSILMIADTMDIGKALLRTADALKLPDEFTSQGVIKYRYTLFSIAQLVAKRLLSGTLPLLNKDYALYESVRSFCKNGSTCNQVDMLVESAWQQIAAGTYQKFSNQHYSGVKCFSVKEFGGLYPHISSAKPTKDTLEDIAKAVHDYPKHVSVCSEDLKEDVRVGIYQFDLDVTNIKEWEAKGFDFWSSFNIYLSWAFRYSPEAKKLAGNYHKIFKQANIEELTLFFSNNCLSMSNPECSKDYLNVNSIREFAKVDQASDLSKLDVFSLSPERSKESVIDPNNVDVRDDLNMNDKEDAVEWAANFNENLAKTRGYLRFKLTQGVSLLKLIKNGVGDNFELKLAQYFQSGTRFVKGDARLDELFLVCSEFKISQDQQVSFLREGINNIGNYRDILSYSSNISSEAAAHLGWFRDQISPKILKLCSDYEQAKFWDNKARPENKYFSPWYQQYVFGKVEKRETELNLNSSRFFTIKNGQTASEEVICHTPVSCVRKILDSVIDLKNVSDHASGILSLNDHFKTPQLTSPIAEKAACGVYDPWAQTKKTAIDFMQNILLAGLSTAVITPIYLDVTVANRKVVSLDELIKDGKVFYNPRFSKKSLQKSLVVDFGPLIGAPCAVGITGDTLIRPPNYLAFEGITVQSCRDSDRSVINAYSPADINSSTRKVSGCFTCTLSLTSVASGAGLVTPGIRPFFYLIRGAVGLFKNLKSPDDIPRSWELDYNSVYRSWRRNDGVIPESCTKNLISGGDCLPDACEANLAISFEREFKTYAAKVTARPGDYSEILTLTKRYLVDTPRIGCGSASFKKAHFQEFL